MGMLDKAFEIAVVFRGVDMLTAPMEKMATKMGLVDKQTEQLQKRLNGFKNMAFVGGAMTAAGAMLVHSMEKGVDEAGEFLTKMTIIRDTTGATADQMERIQKVIRNSSGQTIFGVQETASFGKLLATSGMGGDQIEKLLPVFTQYAEVQKLGKGGSPEEAIKQAIGAAHMTGNYDPEQLSAFLDKYNKATFMQPGSSSEFADTFKYLSSRTQGIGMSTDDQLMMAALSNRVGLAGSIGGTEGADLILRSIPGLMGGRGKKPSKQTAALNELGLTNTIFDEGGNFKGISNFIEQLQKASKGKNPEQLTKLYHDAFGQQGMGLANILSSARGQEQLKALTEQMKTMKSIGQMQEDTNQSPQGQMLQLKTNIENLQLGVFLKLAEYLNPTFKWLNAIVGKVGEFLDLHPRLNDLVAEFGIFLTTLLLTIGPLLLFAGALGYLKTAGIIVTGIKMIGEAFSFLFGIMRAGTLFMLTNPIGLSITALIVILGLLYVAWQNNWGGIQEIFKGVSSWIGNEIDWLSGKLETFMDKLTQTKRQSQIAEDVNIGNTSNDGLSADNGQYKPPGFGFFASGTNFAPGGMAMVGENGPELINLPRGSRVTPNNQLGGGITIASGAIVIYAAPGQSEEDLADRVMDRLGRKIRDQSLSRGSQIQPAW